MSATAPGPPEIRDYLLRRMSEAARTKFEEAYFRDDRLLDRIESEEDLLVSDYVLGRLSDSERRLFEESLLETPYYRDRVETTRGIRVRLAKGRFFRKKAAVATADPASNTRLFPGRTGTGVAFGLLVLLTIASLVSAWFLKSALVLTRKELADRTPRSDAAAQAGVVPLAQTVVLTPGKVTGPSIVRVQRPPGGALLLVFPRALLAGPDEAFGVSLTSGAFVVWDSGELPSKGPEDGDPSLRLPPGVPPAGAYAIRLRARRDGGAPQDSFLGTLDIFER